MDAIEHQPGLPLTALWPRMRQPTIAPQVEPQRGLRRMRTTTKKDLIDRVSAQTGIQRSSVKRTLQCFLQTVINELQAGNRIEFRDFGVFEPRHRAPRVAQNPRTM